MKKWCYWVMACLVICLSSCRKDDELLITPEGRLEVFDYPSEQFDAFWHSMETNYVMWDVDSTDWDQVYADYMPRFQALDSRVDAYRTGVSSEAISDEALQQLYQGALSTILDHHFGVVVYNYWNGSAQPTWFQVVPATVEAASRDYYHPSYINASVFPGILDSPELQEQYGLHSMEDLSVVKHLRRLEAEGRASEIMYSASSYMVVVTALIDDCIPYVYMSSFNISTNAASENAQVEGTNEWMNNQVYDNFYYNVLMLEEDEIDGVIFDLRENTGGSLTDEKFLFGSLIDEPLQAGYIRYKTGLGKYDYSAWTPHFFYPGPYHRTGFQKPVVVISDIRTVSMAEVTSMLAKNFASGCLLGERTFGAHGVVDENSNLYDWSYSGIFGNASGPYWAKVSVAMLKTVDGEILEGVGVTPDIEMKFNLSDVTNGNDTWMDRAIEYVETGK